MKRNYEGCALCDATWGNYWREIDGENIFFCCDICADAFENMVKKVKEVTGWEKIESIKIEGNYSRGRNCTATSGKEKIEYFFRHEDGKLTEFSVKNQGTRPVP